MNDWRKAQGALKSCDVKCCVKRESHERELLITSELQQEYGTDRDNYEDDDSHEMMIIDSHL